MLEEEGLQIIRSDGRRFQTVAQIMRDRDDAAARAQAAEARAEAEAERAEGERIAKERLAARLRELGVDPDEET